MALRRRFRNDIKRNRRTRRTDEDFFSSVPAQAAPVYMTNDEVYERGVADRIAETLIVTIELLLVLRLAFLVLGANPFNGFVSAIYALTRPLVAPFFGIFPEIEGAGFDAATLVAMVVYALVGYVVISLIRAARNRS